MWLCALANTKNNIRIPVIAGPTAGGKSARAMDVALSRNGVIINADSMQVYNALPILSAQPGAQDKAAAPHLLYGVLEPADKCSAPRWAAMAAKEIESILDEGKTPIIVGGTGLYIEALMYGLSPIPDVPPAIRARAMARQAELGNPDFHTDLATRDPVMAQRLKPQDTQRLVRAWEVLEATGKSLAEWQAIPPVKLGDWEFDVMLVMPPRDELHARINRRFDLMMEGDVLEEVASFAARIEGGEIVETAPITNALGFRELRDFLRGHISKDDAVERAKAATRQYAKRQVTWFKNRF